MKTKPKPEFPTLDEHLKAQGDIVFELFSSLQASNRVLSELADRMEMVGKQVEPVRKHIARNRSTLKLAAGNRYPYDA